MRVGFIGLGIMGLPMSLNLQAKGYDLAVWNRTQEKAAELIKNGAQWADTPAAAAQGADILLTMLATPEAVAQTAAGPEGFLAGLRPNSLWADCSTVNTDFSLRMAAQAQEKKVRFLDAPVSGSKGPAEKGELVFLAGGDPADLEEARPLFEAMGKRVIYAGPQGRGTSLKLVVNLMLAQAMAVF